MILNVSKNTIAPPPIATKTNIPKSAVLILLLLFTSIQVVKADQVTLTTKIDAYYDWQGNEHAWTESNLLDYPAYDILDNGDNYTIRRFNTSSNSYDTVSLPKRNYLTYNFGFDTISVSGKIMNHTQAVSVTQPYNATVRYLPLPFSALQIKSVTDDLIDMGLFQRYVNFNVKDIAGTEYAFEKHVIGNEIRLYFLTADFASATYPLFINESTVVVLVANSTSITGEKAQLASDTCCDTENQITAANKGTSTPLTSTELNNLASNDSTTTEVQQAGSTSKDERININFTKSGVQSVNWVKVKVMLRRTGSSDGTRIGLWNYTTNLYQGVKTIAGSTSYQLFEYNITLGAEKTAYLKLNSGVLNFSVVGWGYGGSSDTIAATYFEATIDFIPLTYMPPTPINIINTSGYYYINHSVQAGSGNVTNIFNKSVKINSGSLTWTNNSNPYLNTSGSAGDSVNTTFYAFNNTGNGGTLNTTGIWQNTTVPSTPPTDTSFTVSLPAGETQAYFNASSKTENNVVARNQTSGAGFLYFTNTGNVAEKFFMNVTSTAPSGVTLKADTDNNPIGATTITTTLTQIIASLAISGTQYVWLWVDYSNALPMNQQRTLTTNSSQV